MTINVPHLRTDELEKYIEDIEQNIADIASNWVNTSEVRNIILQYGMDPEKFIVNYAQPILTYFSNVVKKEQEAGNCPVVSKLLEELIKKNVSSAELFTICTNAKHQVLQHVEKKNNLELNHQIYQLFDTNFAGVLQSYYKTILEKDSELKKQSHRLKRILDGQDSFIILTNSKKALSVNKSMFEFLGFESLKEFKDNTNCLCDYFIVEDGCLSKQSDERTWVEVVLDNPNTTYLAKLLNQNKEERIFQISTNGELFDEEIEEEAFYVISMTDITELKAKDHILQSQARLASMGEMMRMIIHQWRQPVAILSTIAGIFELKLEGNKQMPKEHLKDFSSKITNTVSFMDQTIQDFTNFFNNEDVVKETTVKELLLKAKRLLEPQFEALDIDFSITQNVDLLEKITIKGSKFDQVMLNLYKNSIDEFKSKEIEKPMIYIDFALTKEHISISVGDNAGGIDEDKIGDVFDYNFSTKGDDGSGIGLHMSRVIVEDQMGGTINAFNKNGGACFKIVLPLIQ